MKIKAYFIMFFTAFSITNCAASNGNLEKVNLFLNGKKRVLYKSNENAILKGNKVVITNDKKTQFLVLYISKDKNPNTRLFVNNEIIVKIPKGKTIKNIEKKYNIKFIKYINKDINLALFKSDLTSVITKVNKLNKNGIKADFNVIRNWKLY